MADLIVMSPFYTCTVTLTLSDIVGVFVCTNTNIYNLSELIPVEPPGKIQQGNKPWKFTQESQSLLHQEILRSENYWYRHQNRRNRHKHISCVRVPARTHYMCDRTCLRTPDLMFHSSPGGTLRVSKTISSINTNITMYIITVQFQW